MNTLAVILARAGSKGLPDKCVLPLCGRPVIAYTIDHARQSRRLCDVVLSTDSRVAASIGIGAGVLVVPRPPELAVDTARVDQAVRHAVLWYEEKLQTTVDTVVILYGNIPVRADGIIDRCIDALQAGGGDSVRTVAPLTKQHPDWIHRLQGDRLVQFRPNSIHRRQELEPLYYHDGAVVAVTRASLFAAETADDPHAFFGRDRRAVVQQPEDAVDIDGPMDLCVAEAVLRYRQRRPASSAAQGRRPTSAGVNGGTHEFW